MRKITDSPPRITRISLKNKGCVVYQANTNLNLKLKNLFGLANTRKPLKQRLQQKISAIRVISGFKLGNGVLA